MERVDMETIYEMVCVKTVIRFMGMFTTLTPFETKNLVELRLRAPLHYTHNQFIKSQVLRPFHSTDTVM